MSLPHALLTALTEKSGSGLDLARRFDKSIGHFWSATHQQIYRELGRLEQAGLIKAEPLPDSRGQKKIYHVLAAGRDELRRWIPLAEDSSPLRDALMVRLRAEASLGPAGLEPALLHRLAAHRQKLAQYRQIEAEDFPHGSGDRAQALQKLVLEAGIRYEAGWIETLEQALVILRRDDPGARD
ncbi:PadR family transcriptional regulator [Paracoccus sp. M683]|uniref:PadR family transcriptional regulator n=1 Tax=Paracoccus sp. M683 TaxID=2594268 RepID=UPI00117E86F3|nr:helix-turn-helix transcriptional regulator [Paracoccus sp. M683]TRW99230.1 PadR family transcriptional regulator [Paracoccus sp. M683]